MGTSNEDCASVLEQFIHDVANLPAEISHMMEEIQAKDLEMQKALFQINKHDSILQKHVKLQTSLVAHPKEDEWAEAIRKHYANASDLQSQKVALSEKACQLLERQIKNLDVKIRDLQNDGQLLEGLPSVFNRKPAPEVQKQFTELPPAGSSALQVVTNNALNMNIGTHRLVNPISAQLAQVTPRQGIQVTANASNVRSSAPATPSSTLTQHQRHRESSAGATDPKRRKLNPSFTASIPTQPSSLRQSSLGPGAIISTTPKAGTPTGTSASGVRSGSLPRTTSSQQLATTVPKKSGLSKNVAPPHQQISKLKGKNINKHNRLSSSSVGRRKGVSPSVRSRGGGGDDDNDSVLSSADPSDTDSHPTQSKRGRRSKKEKAAAAAAQAAAVASSDHEDIDDEEDQEDDRKYCFCQEKSYGEMVACENDKCKYEWFHLPCAGLKKAPDENEIWYCPDCRKDFVKDENGKKVK